MEVRADADLAGFRGPDAADHRACRCSLLRSARSWLGSRNAARELALFAAPFIWVVLELWRTRLPQIAFPWDMLGFVASHSLAVVQIASLTGIYGLSALVVAYDALLVWALRETRAPARGIAQRPRGLAARWCSSRQFCSARGWCRERTPTNVAHLVQTNLPQYSEFPPNWNQMHAADMAQIDRISIGAGQKQPGLVVWPEVPAPFSLEDAPFAQHAEAIARLSGSDFLLGVIDWKPDGQKQPSRPTTAPRFWTRRAARNSSMIKFTWYRSASLSPARTIFGC